LLVDLKRYFKAIFNLLYHNSRKESANLYMLFFRAEKRFIHYSNNKQLKRDIRLIIAAFPPFYRNEFVNYYEILIDDN
jgi:hypothetical protein